jgi:hypothetical protein
MAEVTLLAANLRIAGHDKAANLGRFLELVDEAGSALLDAVSETFEHLTGSRDLLMQFGVENTRPVLCWDTTVG